MDTYSLASSRFYLSIHAMGEWVHFSLQKDKESSYLVDLYSLVVNSYFKFATLGERRSPRHIGKSLRKPVFR